MIHIVAFSSKGCELALKISEGLDIENRVFSKTSGNSEGTVRIDASLSEWAGESFKRAKGIIFVGATGIAVRAIAPYIKSKTEDPAVICVDELGNYSISLLSGHLGGANNLAYKVSKVIGAKPVISTATDLNEKFSVDSFAKSQNMAIGDMALAKEVSASVLEDKDVGFKSDYPYEGNLPNGLVESDEVLGIHVTSSEQSIFEKTLRLIPRNHVLGIGCKRNTPKKVIFDAVRKVLKDNDISLEGVKLIASIDLKKDEAGLLEFSKEIGVPSVFFTPYELNTLEGEFSLSEFVLNVTGVDCVSERSAIIASDNGKMIVKKTGLNGVTVAVVREPFEFKFGGE